MSAPGPDRQDAQEQPSRGSLELCDLCDGTGDYGEWYCPDCKGSGVIYEQDEWDDD